VEIGRHIQFLALVHNLSRALHYFEKHSAVAFASTCPGTQFDFYRTVRPLFEQLQAVGRSRIKLRLPDRFALKTASNEYDVNELRQWLTEQVMNLARRFDARNGNNYHTRLANESAELLKLSADPKAKRRAPRTRI